MWGDVLITAFQGRFPVKTLITSGPNHINFMIYTIQEEEIISLYSPQPDTSGPTAHIVNYDKIGMIKKTDYQCFVQFTHENCHTQHSTTSLIKSLKARPLEWSPLAVKTYLQNFNLAIILHGHQTSNIIYNTMLSITGCYMCFSWVLQEWFT